MRPEQCATCQADPSIARGRYCAPARCYCGHEQCPAFATWVPIVRGDQALIVAELDNPDRLTARALAAAAWASEQTWRTAPHPAAPIRRDLE